MQEIRPNGDEFLSTGTMEEIHKKAIEARARGSEVNIAKEGETLILKSGQKATVTKDGLRLERDARQKVKNRKKNKAARCARKRARR